MKRLQAVANTGSIDTKPAAQTAPEAKPAAQLAPTSAPAKPPSEAKKKQAKAARKTRVEDDVWAARHWVDWDVERDDNPLHFDGRTWSEVAVADTPDIRSIVALGKNDVWLATLRDVVRLGMGAQVTVPALRGSYSLWGTSSADLWAALDGKLVHYDGNGLQPFTLPGAAQRTPPREAHAQTQRWPGVLPIISVR
mgnify:CR=1 FL=1